MSLFKVGLDFAAVIRSKNRIMSAFLKLEESAILHVRSYLAKLGLASWAPDFTQSPYSLYNMAMRMCAIDTFRFLVGATHYDFLQPDTRLVMDVALLTRLYDHYVHHYQFELWKAEIRTPGGTLTASERNKVTQARRRVRFPFMCHYLLLKLTSSMVLDWTTSKRPRRLAACDL